MGRASKEDRLAAQRIPDHFGKYRRWWYGRHPLAFSQICPNTGWAHRFRIDEETGEGTWGDCQCLDCKKRGYIEYGC